MNDRWHSARSALQAWLLAMVLVGAVALTPRTGYAADYTTAPPPTWVVPVTPGTVGAKQVGNSQDGVAYLLSDTQIRADDRQRVTYRRLVSTALNAKGVDSLANIEISFDPSYQTLQLHAIHIIRDGRVISKLGSARIHVIQRETGLEERIYDGSKTVNVFLDDVRAGDTIDYSYSRSGRNPVFGNHEFGSVSLQFGVPVARIHAQLLLPVAKRVTIVSRNTTTRERVSTHDGLVDHQWDMQDVPAISVEDGAPDWYSPYAELDWSEFADWASVARWAQPLYQVPEKLDPALQAQVDRIAASEPTPVGRMLAALRLVQRDVRYLGVEIGQNSHAPNPPATVFARRFGDCKDKTLLTLTLLHHLGVEAHAALVNTSLRRGIAELQPTPGAFDHVLVQTKVAGKVWWLDPTRDTQNADAAHLFQPDFGLALIVDPATQALTPMSKAGAASDSRSLHVTFDARAGFDQPVRYTVETTTNGAAAESLRSSLSSTNLAEVQKNFLNFYAGSYPQIAVAAPLQVHDDEPANRVITTESYNLNKISAPSEDGEGRVADLHFRDIQQVLRDPAVTIRKAPLRLAYPQDVSQLTEVLLPDGWDIKPTNTVIDDPAFRFIQTAKLVGSRLTITDHFQGLVDELPAADMPRYLGNLARARNIAGYEFSWPLPVASSATSSAAEASALDRMNWPILLLALTMLICFSWLALVLYRFDPRPVAQLGAQTAGIGGWLLLLALVLAVRPLVHVASLVPLSSIVSLDQWSALTTFGSKGYNALWAPSLLFELAAALAQLVFSLLVLLLLFKRRSSFPRIAIFLLIGGVVLQAADLLLAHSLTAKEVAGADISRLVGGVLGATIWSAYLLNSTRVRATFVRRYRLRQPPPFPVGMPPMKADHAGA